MCLYPPGLTNPSWRQSNRNPDKCHWYHSCFFLLSLPYYIYRNRGFSQRELFKKIAALIAIAKGLLIATSETLILCCSSSETFLQVLAVRDGLLVFLLFHGRSKRRWHLFGQAIEVNQASETKLATAPGSGIELSSCPSELSETGLASLYGNCRTAL